MLPSYFVLGLCGREPKGALKLQMCMKHGKAGNYTPGRTPAWNVNVIFRKSLPPGCMTLCRGPHLHGTLSTGPQIKSGWRKTFREEWWGDILDRCFQVSHSHTTCFQVETSGVFALKTCLSFEKDYYTFSKKTFQFILCLDNGCPSYLYFEYDPFSWWQSHVM